MSTTKGPYHDGYSNLAHAILEDGKRCNDQKFLNSDWADILRMLCRLDDEIYGHRAGTNKNYIPGNVYG